MWWFYLAQLFYNPILAFVKASVLCFLLRLGGQKPGVKFAIHFLNAFNALQAIAIFLVAALQCLPIAANWDFALKADPNTKCVDNSFHVTISCITILTDIAVIALPFWIFLGLKMPKAAKIAVLGIFMLGLACVSPFPLSPYFSVLNQNITTNPSLPSISVTIIGIVRLQGVIRLFYVKQTAKDPYYDITVTLSVVEANVAIVSASAPALRPLFRSLLPGLFGGSSARYGPNGKYNYPNSNSPYIFSGAGGSVAAAGTSHHTGSRRDGNESSLVSNGNPHNNIRLKNLRGAGGKGGHTECRSISPSGSEEEIMTYNGIMRTTDVQVHFEGDRDSRAHGHDTLRAGGGDTDVEMSSRASSDLKAGGKEQVEKRTL
jgi:hypothetical protein